MEVFRIPMRDTISYEKQLETVWHEFLEYL